MNTLARTAVRLDHVALFPDTLLTVHHRWQSLLHAMGHPVTHPRAERFRAPPPPETDGHLPERRCAPALLWVNAGIT